MSEYIKHAIAAVLQFPTGHPRIAFCLAFPFLLVAVWVGVVVTLPVLLVKAIIEWAGTFAPFLWPPFTLEAVKDAGRGVADVWWLRVGQYAPITERRRQDFRRQIWEHYESGGRRYRLRSYPKRVIGDVWDGPPNNDRLL
jgi:hypothetical protein